MPMPAGLADATGTLSGEGNLIRERGLNPAANLNFAKGMLAPFGNPNALCPLKRQGQLE